MEVINKKKGNILVNAFMVVLLASIMTLIVYNTTINSMILQNKVFDNNYNAKSASVQLLRLELVALLTNYTKTVVEPSDADLYEVVHDYLVDHYGPSLGRECTYENTLPNYASDEPIPIICTIDTTTNYEIAIEDFNFNLYSYSIASNADLLLNGTSLIGGLIFSDDLYLSNYNLNEHSVLGPSTPMSIEPFLDNAGALQDNYPFFDKTSSQLGVDIFAYSFNGCSASIDNQWCYRLESSTILETRNGFDIFRINQLSDEVVMEYTHTVNNFDDNKEMLPIIHLNQNKNDQLYLPQYEFNTTVNTIIRNIYPGVDDYSTQLDPYIDSTYDITQDLTCYTDLVDTGLCSSENSVKSESAISGISYITYEHVVLGEKGNDNYQLLLESNLEYFGSDSTRIIYIDGDLVINDIDAYSTLTINGNIIITGDLILGSRVLNENLTPHTPGELILQGAIQVFGSVIYDLNSNLYKLNNSLEDIAMIYVKENIIIRDYNYNSPAEDFNFAGFVYTEGSILIHMTKQNSFNTFGGLYSEGLDRDLNLEYPLTIDGYSFDYDGVMVNSYSGEIVNSAYLPNSDPSFSKAKLNPHPTRYFIGGPSTFGSPIPGLQFNLVITEAK